MGPRRQGLEGLFPVWKAEVLGQGPWGGGPSLCPSQHLRPVEGLLQL